MMKASEFKHQRQEFLKTISQQAQAQGLLDPSVHPIWLVETMKDIAQELKEKFRPLVGSDSLFRRYEEIGKTEGSICVNVPLRAGMFQEQKSIKDPVRLSPELVAVLTDYGYGVQDALFMTHYSVNLILTYACPESENPSSSSS